MKDVTKTSLEGVWMGNSRVGWGMGTGGGVGDGNRGRGRGWEQGAG